jgi:hypothetical protein
MKTKIALVTILLPIFLVFLSVETTAKNESSCVGCHTDDSVLKRLGRVPPFPAGEGGG